MRKKKRYHDYDYEEAYQQVAEKMTESQIERLLNTGKVKCCYATKEITSGKMKEIEIYPEFTRRKNVPMGHRSTEAQKNLNDRNSRKHFMRLVYANFTKGDMWITLTWDDKHLPKNIDAAMKYIRNYIARIRYHRKKQNLKEARYIYVIELGEKKERSHVHLIMDGAMSMDKAEELWRGGGRNTLRRIVPDDKGLQGLAVYLSKSPQGTRRWKSSLNLKKPVIKKNHSAFTRRKIKKFAMDQNSIPKTMEKKYQGYWCDECSVRYNEVNGGIYISAKMYRGERRRQ